VRRKNGAAYTRQDASALMRLLFEESDQIGVVFMGVDGCIRGWNYAASHITGFSEEEVVGQSCGSILFTPEDRERKLDDHELQTARIVGFAHDERWHMRKDGLRFWSSGVCLPLKDRKGELTGFVKSYRDMTHLRARMKFLENSLQEQATRHGQHDAFVSTIIHELRSPLSPLKAATRVIQQLQPPGGALEQALGMIDRQTAALERLVEDLVDLTRVKTGKLSILYERAQLQSLVLNAVDASRPAAVRKQIEFHLSLPSVPIELELDPGRMHQVLINLLNNAIKFTPAGGSIWVTATTDQTHALIFVKDNGIGIAPDLLPQIFDMFTQAPDSNTHRGSGLGIGLALVKQVVELHQGTVEVRSEGHGKGSEFSVRVPQRKPHGSENEPDIR
jgi:PAS domain S-box-containing protein